MKNAIEQTLVTTAIANLLHNDTVTFPCLSGDNSFVIVEEKLKAHGEEKVTTSVREIDLMPHDAAMTIIRDMVKANPAISAACASIIAEYLTNKTCFDWKSCANDGKQWKAVKKECEAPFGKDFQFPQQWQNYMSVVKRALSLGLDVKALVYALDGDNTFKVMSRHQLVLFNAENKPESATKEAQCATRLENVVDVITARKSTSDNPVILNTYDVQIAQDTAKTLLDVAAANVTTDTLVSAMADHVGVQSALAAIIRQWGEEATKAALANIFGKDVSAWLYSEEDTSTRQPIHAAA